MPQALPVGHLPSRATRPSAGTHTQQKPRAHRRAPEATPWGGGHRSNGGWLRDTHPRPAFPAPPPSQSPHLRPPVPRWAPPCGNCPWRRRQTSRHLVCSDLEVSGGSRSTGHRPRPASPASPSAACLRPSAAAAPPEVWRRRAGPAN